MINNRGSLFSILRKRDFVVIGFIILVLYLSLESADFSYAIEPSWYLNRGTPCNWPAIPPIVTDMDGDGLREIVAITCDFHIKVCCLYIKFVYALNSIICVYFTLRLL